jgi:hypothetical protein
MENGELIIENYWRVSSCSGAGELASYIGSVGIAELGVGSGDLGV